MRYAERIPYVFVLDYLVGVDIRIKPMFGCFGIYAGPKLGLFLVKRDRPTLPGRSGDYQNGIYVATTAQYVEGLTPLFPNCEFQVLKDEKVWIYLSDVDRDFEQYAILACEMISSNDPRIGR